MHVASCRLYWKQAYLAEIRRDTRGALKNYVRAYELLSDERDMCGVLERLTLCNCITLRMYHLYLGSNDLVSALHHCRIHGTCVRRNAPEQPALSFVPAWCMMLNHFAFAESLEAYEHPRKAGVPTARGSSRRDNRRRKGSPRFFLDVNSRLRH